MNLLRTLVKNNFTFKQSFKRNILSYYEEKTSYFKPWIMAKQTYGTNTSDEIELEVIEFEENAIQKAPELNQPMRNLLYQDNDNDIFVKLKESTCIQNVFDLIEKIEYDPEEKYGWRVWVQSILVLSDLQRIFCEEFLEHFHDYSVCPEKTIANYLHSVNTHKTFEKLTSVILKNVDKLSPEELSCCSLFLLKMGVDKNSPIISSLLYAINEKLPNTNFVWDFESLLRISQFFSSNKLLHFNIISRHLIPRILIEIESCRTEVEFRKISEMFSNIHTIITKSVFLKYKQKLEELLEDKTLENCQPVTILKIMAFLNYPFWISINCNKQFEQLFLLIADKIKDMDANELVFLYKMLKQFHEPAIISKLITKRASYLLEVHKNEDTVSSYFKLINLFYCQFHSTSPTSRQKFEAVFIDIISKSFLSNTLFYFKLARIMKNDNKVLSNMFWTKMMQALKDSTDEDNFKLLKICYKYMYFDNSSTRAYRNYHVENQIIRDLLSHLKNSDLKVIPWKFSRAISFFIAYGSFNSQTNINLINYIDELAKISSQLSLIDNLLLSKGLNLFLKLNARKPLSPSMGQVCLKLNNIILNCANRFLKQDDLSLIELNALTKMFINRITQYDTIDFYNILKKYDECNFELSSKSIKDCVYCMYTSGYVTTSFLNKLCDYIETKQYSLTGDTIHKILSLFYNSGYSPENKTFLEYVANITERDKEIINSLCLLQICEGLCYFDYLPNSLVQFVFSIEFMEYLDKEILACYSKHTYPNRIRKQLMFLNRSVCINMPEQNVPWFHEKYLQQVISLTPSCQSNFYKDVLENLKKVLKDLNFIKCFHFTPYGYNVDFFFQIDKNGKPTLTDSHDNKKVAVLLLEKNAYFKFFRNVTLPDGKKTFSINLNKRGSTQLIMKNLELLNYIVIEISTFTWHSLHMSETNAKFNYIQQRLLDRNIHLSH